MLPKGFLKSLYIAQAGTGGGVITDVTAWWRDVIIPFFSHVCCGLFLIRNHSNCIKKIIIYLEFTSQALITVNNKKKSISLYITKYTA